jgi:hypothetical protein
MVITFRDFTKITFPAFLMDSSNWEISDGLFFCEGKLVDDYNQMGTTIGARRMQTPFKDKYELKKAVSAPNGLMKQNTKYFVDSKGKPFIYEKTKIVPLKYMKIKKVERKSYATLIWVKGHNAPFTVPRPPEDGNTWAGVLHLHGIPWMLYEYSDEKLKDTRRKV